MYVDPFQAYERLPAFVRGAYESPIAVAIRESEVIFPVLQTFHALGIMLMIGTIVLVDLRILGLALKTRSAADVARALLPLTWAGFVLMVVSGALLLLAQVGRIYENDFLRAKLVLLALAGVNVVAFHAGAYRTIRAWDENGAPAAARWAAILSLGLWAAVIVTGRFIAYY